MSGKIFLWLLAILLLTTAPPAQAQQPKKVYRIDIYRRKTQLVSPPVPSQFGWLCASLAT